MIDCGCANEVLFKGHRADLSIAGRAGNSNRKPIPSLTAKGCKCKMHLRTGLTLHTIMSYARHSGVAMATASGTLTEFVRASVEAARFVEAPFYHLEFDRVFPE